MSFLGRVLIASLHVFLGVQVNFCILNNNAVAQNNMTMHMGNIAVMLCDGNVSV